MPYALCAMLILMNPELGTRNPEPGTGINRKTPLTSI